MSEAQALLMPAPVSDSSVRRGMSEQAYFALDRLSQSGIKQLLRSPAHFKYGDHRDTSAMRQGSLIDVALTEPSRLKSDYFSVPDELRLDPRTKAYKVAETEAAGRIMVKNKDMKAAIQIKNKVLSHPKASDLIDGAESQLVITWGEPTEYGVVPMKGRIDWHNKRLNTLIDLKTTVDAREFPRTAANFGYYMQDACYRHGWTQATAIEPETFVFIVVERDPPYGIKLYELTSQALALGWNQYRKGVELYAHCRHYDNWYGYDPFIEEVDLPVYTYMKHDQED